MFTRLAADELASPRPTTPIPEQACAAHELASPPQSAILGTGAVVERVVPRRSGDDDLTLAVRSMVYPSLSYDRRIIDGADAARYLGVVKAQLESAFGPEELP